MLASPEEEKSVTVLEPEVAGSSSANAGTARVNISIKVSKKLNAFFMTAVSPP
jgi:hypothetical protein